MLKSILPFAIWAWCLTVAVADDLPKLSLPWGTWEAARFPEDKNAGLLTLLPLSLINVRFGAKPERFGAPSFPDWNDDNLQDSRSGRSCIQIDPDQSKNAPGGRHRLFEKPDKSIIQDEDCLFLDIYVPATAFEKKTDHLPVVVWLYGGAYAFGSKDQFSPLYTGQSMLEASDYGTIFVAGNYRLGAFGWLAGSYMQDKGQPNAGLYDQALLFEWVQKYIEQVRGDRNSVSAWGESAGASSILHHLIREDGKVDPNFSTFLVQSPAFEWQWDNSKDGTLDKTFRDFSDLSGCGDKYDIECLRKADAGDLARSNQKLFDKVRQTGLFPIGKYWEHIWSTIVSHVANEAQTFVKITMDSQEKFDKFLAEFLPGDKLSGIRDQIREQYDCESHYDGNFTNCLKEVIQDSSFTCNTRDLFEAYPDRSYMMEYAFPSDSLAYHASDLVPLFANNVDQVLGLLSKVMRSKILAKLYAKVLEGLVATKYKAYFASFALTGDPNAMDQNPRLFWPVADGGKDELSDVLRVSRPGLIRPAFRLTSDDQNTIKTCEFWNGIARQIMELGGGGSDDGVHEWIEAQGDQRVLLEL
ncbi:carboxylesterase family protein [Colletotrichum sojae]|uniref:Carboxylesterase family protein n=1 Tax=Colletotrichum sojae TaxID=2175907 RepID=A0A8H6IYJ7_9PEZI|nr:carboxylesterase family protein [Colletotrichum sojae]